jgi:hypothetical protein
MTELPQMAAFFGDLPDWVKLLGPPALWGAFMAGLLWFILKIILPLIAPREFLIDWVRRHPGWGIAFILPIAISPVIILSFVAFHLFFQLIEPDLESMRELKAYRAQLTSLAAEIGSAGRRIDTLAASTEFVRPGGQACVLVADADKKKVQDQGWVPKGSFQIVHRGSDGPITMFAPGEQISKNLFLVSSQVFCGK